MDRSHPGGKVDMSLKEFIAGVIQSLPVSTDDFVQEFLHVLHQDLFPCVVPVGVAATFMSVLSAVFVAYRWNRTPNSKSSEVSEGDALGTVGGKETQKTHAKTNQRSQVCLDQLKSVVTTIWRNKLEDRLEKSDVLQKQLQKELETARRDLEASRQQTDRKLWQKEQEVNLITEKLKKMTEEQQSLAKTTQRSQVCLGQLKSVVTTIWRNKLEDRLEKSDVLQKQLQKELETARRDLEASRQQTDRKLWQKEQEVNLISEKLKKMTEEQQSLAKTNQRSQVCLGQLKSVVTTIWRNKLEDRLEKSDVLQKQLQKELETARRDLEASRQQTDNKLWQKEQEVNLISEKLKKMTEEQQSLLQESKREAESLIKEKKDLEKKLTEVKKDDNKESEADVLQQLKAEQQKREDAEKSLQELKTELDSKSQKLKVFSEKVENLHEMLRKTEESQQVLMKELQNHNNEQQKNPEESAAEEPNLDSMMSEMTELRNELEVAQAQSEALTEKNQQLEAQLADLKQRYNQEFKTIIAEEREWREELDRDLEGLRKEYENKKNELKTIQKEADSKTSEDDSASAEEEEIYVED